MNSPDEILRQFIDTVDAAGGVFRTRKGALAPVGDPDWIDLALIYEIACSHFGREMKIGRDPEAGMACKHCGGEVEEIDEGPHFTAVHVGKAACKFARLGEDDVLMGEEET